MVKKNSNNNYNKMFDLSPMFVFAGQKYMYLIYTGFNKRKSTFYCISIQVQTHWLQCLY